MSGIAARCAAAAIALLAMAPRGSDAAAVPDSAALARLNTAAMEHNRFRIVTDHGQFLATSLRLDAAGVVVRAPQARPAVIVSSPLPDETRRATWSEVDRIEGMRSRGFQETTIGALVGGVIGLAAKEMFEGRLHDASDLAIVAIPIGAVLGAVVGAVHGTTTGWRLIYP